MDDATKTLIKDSFKSIDLYPMNDKLKEMCKTPNGCYEPPFTGYMGDYAQKMVEEINEQGDTVIYNEIVRQIAIDVDKDEMIRALNYDRDQYNKGYNDGYTRAREQYYKTGHWEDCSNGWMCSECGRDNSKDTDFCPHCGADMRDYGTV